MSLHSAEGLIEIVVNAISIKQPIGEFLIASIPSKVLCDIAFFDVRRMLKERDIETYLGIQRPLNEGRVSELQTYVRTVDACFPTAVILAVDGRCASFDPNTNKLTLRNCPNPEEGQDPIYYRNIAKVLDGQHRIAGLMDYADNNFEVNVSIFIDIDIEDQAYIFSTVNLAQTKVNRSLAYDLSELAKTRSPQKTCHNIAVALDRLESSPFHHRIKRLGSATPGRTMEMITQATFVEALMPFISGSPALDRDILKRGNKLAYPSQAEIDKYPLRPLFVDGKDMEIADVIFQFFSAVEKKWPHAWSSTERGHILNKTNGFKALMRILRVLCRSQRPHLNPLKPEALQAIFDRVELVDADFTTDNFKPGTSGESNLYTTLTGFMGLDGQRPLF